FQAEDGIRDKLVTGVQTCALPICDCQQVKKLPFPILFFFGPVSLPENLCRQALLDPVISSADFGHLLDEPLPHRGDPFSHPSGSSARPKEAFLVLGLCLLFFY